MNQSGFFQYKVLRNDGDMLEVNTEFSDGRNSGSNKTYDSAAALHAFALELMDFYSRKEPLKYESGVRNGYSYLLLNLFFAEPRGIIAIRIYSENNADEHAEFRSIVHLEIRTEVEALQRFARELLAISVTGNGIARIN
ncbi:MAG: hypothetical protein MUC87_17225 [Bacteroidia bacterium]|jgi:hypothetical protein|nr:hypothetical protein [Bacteroidia bacterium]